MRLNLTKSQVKTIGIKPLMKVDYTAKQNNTVFTILTKSLYLRPINAIVRELCTNCLDAHIAVNKQDQPFDVTLPTKLDPYFIVRDYGCSMDIDQVVKVYSMFHLKTLKVTLLVVGVLEVKVHLQLLKFISLQHI